MKRLRHFIEFVGWEFLFFLIAAFIGVTLILKTISDFLNKSVQPGPHFKFTPDEFKNALVALLLTHFIYRAHRHVKKRREKKLVKDARKYQ
jgi:hypothetical protein